MPVSTPLPSPPAPADEATAPAIIDGPASVDEVTAESRWRASASDVPTWERRLGAVVLDLALLGAIDALIISFTSQIVGVPVSTFTRAPLIPLLGFLGLLNFAYLFSLVAAAGQTLGKMAFQLKVVSDEGHEASTGAAAVRAAAVAVTVLLGGLPFLLAFIDARGRAPHDHLAGTRVIKL